MASNSDQGNAATFPADLRVDSPYSTSTQGPIRRRCAAWLFSPAGSWAVPVRSRFAGRRSTKMNWPTPSFASADDSNAAYGEAIALHLLRPSHRFQMAVPTSTTNAKQATASRTIELIGIDRDFLRQADAMRLQANTGGRLAPHAKPVESQQDQRCNRGSRSMRGLRHPSASSPGKGA
jgi:hypothetical protein